MKRAADLFGRSCASTGVDALDTMPDMDGGVRNADLIIEAVPEKLELKQKVCRAGARMKAGAILATTPQYSAAGSAPTAKPERLVGLHFFNPVSQLQLVESSAAARVRRP